MLLKKSTVKPGENWKIKNIDTAIHLSLSKLFINYEFSISLPKIYFSCMEDLEP